jgi:hypothetical protein
MEPDVKKFLTKIAATISMVLLWMLINSSIGIGMNYAFFDDKPRTGNYIFYAWFIISLILLIIYVRKKWKD